MEQSNLSSQTPGMIFRLSFDKPGGKSYKGFVNYIGREQAVNPFAFDDYVLKYMDNSEKTSGIFTGHINHVNKDQRKELKALFERAQNKGSLLWKPIISFDNQWLIDNGLMDPETKEVDEEKLRNCTRKALGKLLEKENLPNGYWAGAIHKNTDNIHIHLAFIDPNPSWTEGEGRCFRNENGDLEQKGKFRAESIRAFKSTFVNTIVNDRERNQRMSELTRDTVYSPDFTDKIDKNFFLHRKFIALADKLPYDRRLLKYGNNFMKPYRKEIDRLTDAILDHYYHDEMEELKSLLKQQEEAYKNAYGDKGNDYYENKMKDLHQRAGNQILKEVYEYKQKTASKKYQMFGMNKPKGRAWEGYKLSRAGDALSAMKKSLRKDFESIKNERAYDRMNREIDYQMDEEHEY
jgi:hypothetical protein